MDPSHRRGSTSLIAWTATEVARCPSDSPMAMSTASTVQRSRQLLLLIIQRYRDHSLPSVGAAETD